MSDPPEPVQRTWMAPIAGFLLAIFFSLISSSIYLAVAGPNPPKYTLPALFSGFIGLWIVFIGVPYLVSRDQPGGFREQTGFRFEWPRDLIKGIGLGIGAQVLVAVLYIPVGWVFPDQVKSVSEPAKNLTSALSGWRWFAFAFFVGIMAPICEEIFFRGLTLRSFTARWGPVIGVIGSALFFGLAHIEGIQTPALVLFGALLAVRALKTRRIGETIIAHATFNLTTVFVLYLSR